MSSYSLISIVIPFYNEGNGVTLFYKSISRLIDRLSDVRFEVVCVYDGRRDDTLVRLIEIAANDQRFRVIGLSRNFGKEAALTAGIDASLGDAVIPMDADLQDPPELISKMIAEWRAGSDIVLAKRSDRIMDSFRKRKTAVCFYKKYITACRLLLYQKECWQL